MPDDIDSILKIWEGINGGYCTVIGPLLEGPWAIGRTTNPRWAQPMVLNK